MEKLGRTWPHTEQSRQAAPAGGKAGPPSWASPGAKAKTTCLPHTQPRPEGRTWTHRQTHTQTHTHPHMRYGSMLRGAETTRYAAAHSCEQTQGLVVV